MSLDPPLAAESDDDEEPPPLLVSGAEKPKHVDLPATESPTRDVSLSPECPEVHPGEAKEVSKPGPEKGLTCIFALTCDP